MPGLLPAVQEGSEEARFEESLPMDSSGALGTSAKSGPTMEG